MTFIGLSLSPKTTVQHLHLDWILSKQMWLEIDQLQEQAIVA
jgi:hypothetical protein